ncbi:MAG: metallophosphoesterase, partial [Nanoarchaeota archaeon]
GDLHGDISVARALANKADKEKVDLVVLAGDITGDDTLLPGVISPFLEKKKRVLFVPGNHESMATADFIADFYGITNLHGYSVKYQNVGIFGCSGNNIGVHQISEDEIFSLLKKGFEKVKNLKKKVMVTHVHPSDTKIGKFGHPLVREGSEGIRKAVKKFKPDILICSHIHEAAGIEEKLGKTKIINVGTEGKIIEI